jgi:hypothetical protein
MRVDIHKLQAEISHQNDFKTQLQEYYNDGLIKMDDKGKLILVQDNLEQAKRREDFAQEQLRAIKEKHKEGVE